MSTGLHVYGLGKLAHKNMSPLNLGKWTTPFLLQTTKSVQCQHFTRHHYYGLSLRWESVIRILFREKIYSPVNGSIVMGVDNVNTVFGKAGLCKTEPVIITHKAATIPETTNSQSRSLLRTSDLIPDTNICSQAVRLEHQLWLTCSGRASKPAPRLKLLKRKTFF